MIVQRPKFEPPVIEARRAYFTYFGGGRDERGRPTVGFEKFGCGWRLIYVRFVGRKWVYLIDPTTLDTARVSKREIADWPLTVAGTPSAEAMILRQYTTRRRLNMNVAAPVTRLVKELQA